MKRKTRLIAALAGFVAGNLVAAVAAFAPAPPSETGERADCPTCNPPPNCYPGDPCAGCG